VGQALRPATKMSADKAADLFNTHQHELIEMARAYVELEKWKALDEKMREQTDADQAKVFRRLRDTYGLSLIEKHMAWHLMYGRLPMSRARQLNETLGRLCAKLTANALDLVDAFGYGHEHRRATISTGIEAQRQAEGADYCRRTRAKQAYPADEKELRKAAKQKAKAAAKQAESRATPAAGARGLGGFRLTRPGPRSERTAGACCLPGTLRRPGSPGAPRRPSRSR